MQPKLARLGELLAALMLVVAMSCLVFAPKQAYAQADGDCVDVLFVGNSFTYTQSTGVAEALRALASANGKSLYAQRVSFGSATLQGYLGDYDFAPKHKLLFDSTLASRSWDYVVLQENTSYPITNPGMMHSSINLLVERIHAVCPNAGVLLYATHGYANGTPLVMNGVSRQIRATDFQAYVQGCYISIGSRLGLRTVPVGLCYAKMAQLNSSVNLYASDKKHPNAQGFLLAASSFYNTIFSEPPAAAANFKGIGAAVQQQMFDVATTESLAMNPASLALPEGAVSRVSCDELIMYDSGTGGEEPGEGTGGEGGAGEGSGGDGNGTGTGGEGSGGSGGSGDDGGAGAGGDGSGGSGGDGSDGSGGDGDSQDPDPTPDPSPDPDPGPSPDPDPDPDPNPDPDPGPSPDPVPTPIPETWSFTSVDPTIASVNPDGVVTARKIGKTVVYATSSLGRRAYCYVSVESRDLLAKKILMPKQSYVKTAGETLTINPQISESMGKYSLKWVSTNTAVATVDALGVVTTKKAGYAVISVRDTITGAAAACSVKVRPPAPTKLRAKRSAGVLEGKKVLAVRLNWKAVAGSKSYKVYRSAGGKKYSLIGSTKSAKYLDRKAPLNKMLSYKVVAVDKKSSIPSLRSESVSAVHLGKVSLMASVSGSGVNLTWGKGKLADGYILYRAKGKSGSFTKLKKFNGRYKTRYFNKAVSKGQVYRYKLKAYKVVSGRTYYSAYSKVVKVHIPKPAKKAKSKKTKLVAAR